MPCASSGISSGVVGHHDRVPAERVRPEQPAEQLHHVLLPPEVVPGTSRICAAGSTPRIGTGDAASSTSSYRPICTVARYVAIGAAWSNTQVVRLAFTRRDTSRPFATTWYGESVVIAIR